MLKYNHNVFSHKPIPGVKKENVCVCVLKRLKIVPAMVSLRASLRLSVPSRPYQPLSYFQARRPQAAPPCPRPLPKPLLAECMLSGSF